MNQRNSSRYLSTSRSVALCILSLVLLGSLAACAKKAPPSTGRPPTPVEVVQADQKDVSVYVDAFGQLAAMQNVDIVAQVGGKLLEARFKEGDKVSKGDVLFTIDPATYQADLDKAKAALSSDQAD
ncbi:MAG: biotin/lipoyl-binding protein, partial [Lentisphaerota bacterium]